MHQKRREGVRLLFEAHASDVSGPVLSMVETIPKCDPRVFESIERKGSENSMNGKKNRAVVVGLALLAVVAVVGLVAGNGKIQDKLNERSKQISGEDFAN